MTLDFWKIIDVAAARVQWWVMKTKRLRAGSQQHGFSVVLASAESHAVSMYSSADVFWWMRNHEGICFAWQVETWQLFVMFVTCHLLFHEVNTT